MLGMDQAQRSNAVGFNPSYLPDGEGARHGGGTYTGNATEPTIQDYENFFGPSARDIKTDLQRFKRHGRWHLPDILQGPNPWLTDRIDGLITDGTNSAFTTKILPYRYKEEVDGKIKWNVWNFDEGMASRVPYESAARTLTQSKRSFAGYMVRQGMAIVLEHNFMMTPKGRENFKNQLDQLIGSIQYTNDLDVHMALILAPSYQTTMRERYYKSDKSASQICREFADLFGMMQKNVNALDILIEEGKAILRTWGGPMPDFLLCNSKLTFQMTMTPEKTNYITQGIDGVKRLRQGPDLGTYRGLSVIHSRSFAMETGQHPRDVLRRRVRTAEYYRIPPNKKNASREFEFYNEERDTWFTMSFQELLRCARYYHLEGSGGNAGMVDAVSHSLAENKASTDRSTPFHLADTVGGLSSAILGAYKTSELAPGVAQGLSAVLTAMFSAATRVNPVRSKVLTERFSIRPDSLCDWVFRGFGDNMGIKLLAPRENEVWQMLESDLQTSNSQNTPGAIPGDLCNFSLSLSSFTPEMVEQLYLNLKYTVLNDPFHEGRINPPGTTGWFTAFTFYMEIFKRGGLALDYLSDFTAAPALAAAGPGGQRTFSRAQFQDVLNLTYAPSPDRKVDLTCQFLSCSNATGSVNHPFHMMPGNDVPDDVVTSVTNYYSTNAGTVMARRLIMTAEILVPLLQTYNVRGEVMTGLDYFMSIKNFASEMDATQIAFFSSYNDLNPYAFNIKTNKNLATFFRKVLMQFPPADTNVGTTGEILARAGISTIPLHATSMSHLFFSTGGNHSELKKLSVRTDGHLNIEMLEFIREKRAALSTEKNASMYNLRTYEAGPPRINVDVEIVNFFKAIQRRIYTDPYDELVGVGGPPVYNATLFTGAGGLADYLYPPCFLPSFNEEMYNLAAFAARRAVANRNPVSTISPERFSLVVDLEKCLRMPSMVPPGSSNPTQKDLKRAEDVEIVVIRPNIEHNMLGVIMGLGGESLGNTLWGQTELSVYDDSMHGIWGMSYKYHERAIVFNEKNLIRMWDIAYDGYNGGKDDTYVNWLEEDEGARNGPHAFKNATMDLSQNYRGPSMMVMAFVHDKARVDDSGRNVFERDFRRNWPSPIVFYDNYNGVQQQKEALPIDYDNVQTVEVEEFRVFNNDLYYEAYKDYRRMMPEFRTMHLTRKSAGQSSADAETGTDCLAFQGSMRIKDGGIVQEIQGSGHHGPDYVGVASVRAGKGQKVAGQAPAPYRLV